MARNQELEKILKKVLLAQEKTNRTLILLGAGSYLTREEEPKEESKDTLDPFQSKLKEESKKNILFRDIRFLPIISKMTEIKRSSPGLMGAASFPFKLASAAFGGIFNRKKVEDEKVPETSEQTQESKKAEENSDEAVASLEQSTDYLEKIEENTRLTSITLKELVDLNEKQYREMKLQSLAAKVRQSESDADSAAAAAAGGAAGAAEGGAAGAAQGGAAGAAQGGSSIFEKGLDLGRAATKAIATSGIGALGGIVAGSTIGLGKKIGKYAYGKFGKPFLNNVLRGHGGLLMGGRGTPGTGLRSLPGRIAGGLGRAGASALSSTGTAITSGLSSIGAGGLATTLGGSVATAGAGAIAGTVAAGAAIGGAAGYGLNKLGSAVFGEDEFNDALLMGGLLGTTTTEAQAGLSGDQEFVDKSLKLASDKTESTQTARVILGYARAALTRGNVEKAVEIASMMPESKKVNQFVVQRMMDLNNFAIDAASSGDTSFKSIDPDVLRQFGAALLKTSKLQSITEKATTDSTAGQVGDTTAAGRLQELDRLGEGDDPAAGFARRAAGMMRQENQQRLDALQSAGIVPASTQTATPTRTATSSGRVTPTPSTGGSSANVVSAPSITNQTNNYYSDRESSSIGSQDAAVALASERQGV